MARKLRVEYPGAVYHVMNRGDRRKPIFKDDADRQRFVATLAEAGAKTGWQVHAYVLMPNHFHLVVATPLPNLVAADAPLKSFAWSSWPEYLRAPSRRPAWLWVGRLLGGWGIPKDSPAGRQWLEQALEARRGAAEGEEFKPIRRGWCLGGEAFRQELLAQMSRRMGEHHYGLERAESAEERAARIVEEELARAGWTEGKLRQRPKGDTIKVAAATRLRRETTMTLKWISQRLEMGAWTHLKRRLYEQRRSEGETPS